uniref:Gamma-glutamylcyclotransferase family protein n=1 Tax=Picea sitchensis TaxID=3332 RepID=A9NNC2_PICSI|nr:unknown [Picea sitchensis]
MPDYQKNMGRAQEEKAMKKICNLPPHSNNNNRVCAQKCAEEKVLVFVYGTLKRGFGNHWLIEEMIAGGHAEFVGIGRSEERYPLVCGPYQVPFLLYLNGFGEHVFGEVYAIDAYALQRFDELEGTTKGHYVRRSIRLRLLKMAEEEVVLESQAYFAANSYTPQMWMKTRHNCLCTYSVEETKNYVRRKDRPPHLSFLEHINIFLSQQSTHPSPPPAPSEITAGHC